MDLWEIRAFLEEANQEELNPNLTGCKAPTHIKERIPAEIGGDVVPINEYDISEKGLPSNIDDPRGLVEPLDAVETKEQMFKEAVDQEGFEKFAWYVPFHFAPHKFGIYITEIGIQLLGNLLFAWSRDLDKLKKASSDSGFHTDTALDGLEGFDEIKDAFELAVEIYRRHEEFHHQVELLSSYLEDVNNQEYYVDYYRDIYQPSFPEKECLEETLANAFVHRSRACKNRAPSDIIFDLLFYLSTELQPPAYAAYDTVLDDQSSHRGRLMKSIIELDKSYLENSSTKIKDRLQISDIIPLGRPLTGGEVPVPIYIVESKHSPKSIAYFRQIQLETDYEIIKTNKWESKLKDVDKNLSRLAKNIIPKLKNNINHSGIEWKWCEGNVCYGRLNQQYRFVARRYDKENRIELIDFGHHDLPKKYGCHSS